METVRIVLSRLVCRSVDFFCLDAPTKGTVYFSSPLYRKNLHYRVVPKPAKAADLLEAMRDYILEYHPNHTGIIYCFTTKVFFFLSNGNPWRFIFRYRILNR